MRSVMLVLITALPLACGKAHHEKRASPEAPQTVPTGPDLTGKTLRKSTTTTYTDGKRTGERVKHYDAAGRLVEQSGDGWFERYAYDAAGRRIKKAYEQRSGETLQAQSLGESAYDDQGRMIRDDYVSKRRNAAGELVVDYGYARTYVYDAADKLTSYEQKDKAGNPESDGDLDLRRVRHEAH